MTQRLFAPSLRRLALAASLLALVPLAAPHAFAAGGARQAIEETAPDGNKKGKALPKEQLLKRGMAAAPAALQLAGVANCTPESAVELGKTPDKATAYEIDCAGDAARPVPCRAMPMRTRC